MLTNTQCENTCLLLAGALLPAVVLFIMVQFMSESPQWLFSQQRDEEARAVISIKDQWLP